MSNGKYSVLEEGGVTRGYVATFIIDTPEDLESVPKDNAVGSACFVISTQEVYMLNNEKEWKKI